MNVIQRVRFPFSSDASKLYVKLQENVRVADSMSSPAIFFDKNGSISLNTYFNSVYESQYAEFTDLRSLYFLLSLEGDFKISVYREYFSGERRLISSQEELICERARDIKIDLPDFGVSGANGRIYLEMECLGANGQFYGGTLSTAQEKTQHASIGIVICTFKKEDYVKKTIWAILQDKGLASKEFLIYLVDNGRALRKEDFVHDRVKLIGNINSGGSGGFTRGLLEASANGTHTHFLLMDDDIDIDSEALYRLFSIHEYAKKDIVIAGSMLELHARCVLHEAGSLYNRAAGVFVSHQRLKHDLSLADSSSLDNLIKDEEPDYGGWWFFSFSKDVLSKTALPLPFFVKWDDMEFCLRMKKRAGVRIAAFPSIAVWHDLAYVPKDFYYHIRNYMVVNALHRNIGYIKTVSAITSRLIRAFADFEYNLIALYIKAFEDYLKGPDFLKKSNPQELLKEVIESSNRFASFAKERAEFDRKYGNAIIRKMAVFLTALFLEKSAAVQLLLRWMNLIIFSGPRWYSVRDEWRISSKDMVTAEFWREYLGIAG